jgi:hypothetical protein
MAGEISLGRAQLPARTQAYLAHGASEGNRNSELIAAACQCRDAGMSESETERILVPHALSDGLMESEAISTIHSAFSRSARDPLRSNIAQGDFQQPELTPEQRERIEAQKAERRLAARAHAGQVEILQKFACGFAYYVNLSPVNLYSNDPHDDWRLILKLFKPDDVVWIGTKKNDSANATHPPEWIQFCKTRFRPASEWLKEKHCPGILTCPNAFNPSAYSRRNTEVLTRRFLVLESDTLDKNKVCAVFKWTEQFTRLRAIVDTAGKSLHGWFDMPPPDVLEQLETILPQLGCDSAMFIPSQPCRLPGAHRPDTGRVQSLLYLDLEAQS